jgi:glutathione S-transferase
VNNAPFSAQSRLRLHGYAVSNYFNIARAALLEKGAEFEVSTRRASQEPGFLELSPMGKIPFLETPWGCIAETVAILEFLEDALPGPRLHPRDPFERAKVRQTMNVVQMYVEAPARTLFPGVFMGGCNSEATVAAARPVLVRAMRALRHLVAPGPFLLGSALTYADLFAFYCLDIAERLSRFVYGESLLVQVEGLSDWSARMARRVSSRVVLPAFEEAFSAYLVEKNAVFRPA